MNANNSVNDTSSNLISSSTDEESNESEKCDNAYAFQQGLMLAGLGKTKLSRRKRIKVNYFPDGKTEDLQYYLITYVDKKPDNISSSILVPTVLHNKLKTLYTKNW